MVIARKNIWVKQSVSSAHVWKNIKGLSLTFTAQSQPWLSMCAKQAIKLRGKIPNHYHNDFVCKPGISTLVLMP